MLAVFGHQGLVGRLDLDDHVGGHVVSSSLIQLPSAGWVVRPFLHGVVVHRDVVVAEQRRQHEGIERGGDAAAAIDQHALVGRGAHALEGGAQLGRSASASCPARTGSPPARRTSRRCGRRGRRPRRPLPLCWSWLSAFKVSVSVLPIAPLMSFLSTKISGPAAQGERRRRIGRGLGRERAVLRLPLVEPAIEDRGVVEAHGAQHPPEARRPVRRGVAVEHDEGAVADALGGEGLGQLVERRQGEAELGVRVGKLAAEIEEGRAGNVALVVVGAPAFGVVAALRARA